MNPKVVVVIPAYNESEAITDVVNAALAIGQVVVVDDASTDGTSDLAITAGAVVVTHTSNRGYDGALASGLRKALSLGADVAVTMDADGQHGVDSARRLLAALEDGIDLVVGTRPAKARWSEHVFAGYTQLRYGLPDPMCGLKAYRSSVIELHQSALDLETIGSGLTLAAIATGSRFRIVDIPIQPRLGTTRFGAGYRANLRILKGLTEAIRAERRARRKVPKANPPDGHLKWS